MKKMLKLARNHLRGAANKAAENILGELDAGNTDARKDDAKLLLNARSAFRFSIPSRLFLPLSSIQIIKKNAVQKRDYFTHRVRMVLKP